MKEFHLMFAKAENKKQLTQLLNDCYNEIVVEKVPSLEAVMFFDKYYNLNFGLVQLARLGRFIKSGKHKKEMELYV